MDIQLPQIAPKLVHLDLKGAPPNLDYLRKIAPLLRKLGANGFLVEYEDTFPYQSPLEGIASRQHAYDRNDLWHFIADMEHAGMQIIPLVQTFGHMEVKFVLKHSEYKHLREHEWYPNSICPTHEESFPLICKMLLQVLQFHPNADTIHIGCDEVFQLGVCVRCRDWLLDQGLSLSSPSELFLHHVVKIATFLRSQRPGLRVLIWDDMLRPIEVASRRRLVGSFVRDLADFVEPVVWFYGAGGCPDVWANYASLFPTIWCASAFKGASGPIETVPDVSLHVSNHQLWLAVISDNRINVKRWGGFILTGWSRYDHMSVLCELLPSALPSLFLCLSIMRNGQFSQTAHKLASSSLGTPNQLIPITSNKSENHFAKIAAETKGNNGDLFQSENFRQSILEGSFPGHDIYVTTCWQANLLLRLKGLLESDLYKGWLNAYNVSTRGEYNEGVVRQIGQEADNLLSEFQAMRNRTLITLASVFDEVTVLEWTETHCGRYIRKLQKIADRVRVLVSSAPL